MVKFKIKYNPLIWLALFCLIYNPPLLPFNSMHLVGVLSWAYFALNFKRAKMFLRSKTFMIAIGFFCLLTAYLLAVSTFSPKGDFDIVYFPIYFLVDIIPFGAALIIYQEKRQLGVSDFYNLVLGVAIIQALLAVFAFFIPAVQETFVNMFINYGYDDLYTDLADHRLFGLAGTLTFSTPVLQSFLAVCCLYRAVEKERIKNILISILLMFSAIINARSAIVVLIVGVVAFVFSRVTVSKKLVILSSLALGLVLFLGLVFPLISENDNSTFSWVVGGVEEILAFFKGDNIGYFVYITDPAHYVLPNGIFSLLTGEGHAIMGGLLSYGIESDVGFINDIWRGGFIYVIVLYLFALRLLWSIFRNTDKYISFIGLLAIFEIPIINFKGSIIRMNELTIVLFLVFMLASIKLLENDEWSKTNKI